MPFAHRKCVSAPFSDGFPSESGRKRRFSDEIAPIWAHRGFFFRLRPFCPVLDFKSGDAGGFCHVRAVIGNPSLYLHRTCKGASRETFKGVFPCEVPTLLPWSFPRGRARKSPRWLNIVILPSSLSRFREYHNVATTETRGTPIGHPLPLPST